MRKTEPRDHDMRCRRILGLVTVFLAMSGSMLGSEPEKRLQVQWGELKKLIGGKKVTLQLVDGERLEGRARKFTATSLTVKVKKSSNPVAYPKGKIRVPREAVSRIEARNPKIVRVGRGARRIGLTVGAFVGALFVSFAAVSAAGSDSGGTVAEGTAIVAIATGAAVLAYRALRPKGVTLIEILPDPPGERVPKPKNKQRTRQSAPVTTTKQDSVRHLLAAVS